jgi:hypothetical protein
MPNFHPALISIKPLWRAPVRFHPMMVPEAIEMTRYVVKFFKEVIGDNGREAETCQGALEVEAPSPLEAAERGKREFCNRGRLSHWSLHADRVSVAETEYPS